jgi:hypothetical protein
MERYFVFETQLGTNSAQNNESHVKLGLREKDKQTETDRQVEKVSALGY